MENDIENSIVPILGSDASISAAGSLGFPVKPRPMRGWTRNDFIRMCINMGLNGPQISTLSLSTPQPMKHSQQVYDCIQSQRLDKLFIDPAVQRRRVGPHNKGIIRLFMKTYGQALEYDFEVSDVLRDECPEPGARFRADLGMRIGERQFYWEYQASKLEFTRWHAKLKNYIRLYELLKEPFRACIILQDERCVTKVRAYARQVLERKHPRLNLFYFITDGEFDTKWDVVKGSVWKGAWDDEKMFSLL